MGAGFVAVGVPEAGLGRVVGGVLRVGGAGVVEVRLHGEPLVVRVDPNVTVVTSLPKTNRFTFTFWWGVSYYVRIRNRLPHIKGISTLIHLLLRYFGSALASTKLPK